MEKIVVLLNLIHFPHWKIQISNSSNSSIYQEKSFDDQDKEMLKVLEELHFRKLQLWVSSITADKNRHGSSPPPPPILGGGT